MLEVTTRIGVMAAKVSVPIEIIDMFREKKVPALNLLNTVLLLGSSVIDMVWLITYIRVFNDYLCIEMYLRANNADFSLKI